jgi:hypothetical protein
MIDSDGNNIWNLALPGGDLWNNLLQYKLIDSATDMVVATSGLDLIRYSRILH